MEILMWWMFVALLFFLFIFILAGAASGGGCIKARPMGPKPQYNVHGQGGHGPHCPDECNPGKVKKEKP